MTSTTDAARPVLARSGRRGLTVQGTLLLVLGLLAAIVVIGAVLAATLLAQTNRSSDRVIEKVQPAQLDALKLQAALINQETGLRGYAMTADPQFLQPYTDGKKSEASAAAEIRRLLPHEEKVLADLSAIEKAADSWRVTYAEPLVGSVLPGNPRPVDRRSALEARNAFDNIRSLFAKQSSDLVASQKVALDSVHDTREKRQWVLIALIAALFAVGLVVTLLMRALVVRPLDQVRNSSRRIADGDFDHQISGTGPVDIRAMADDVEAMRRRIVAELTAAREAERHLAEQAASLDAQALELRRSNAELEQFAYVASHDLQEPLRKIASFCQLLEKRYSDNLDERGKQYIDFVVDGAKRMQVLITDLLTFSRVGRTTEHKRDISLDVQLDKALENLDSLVEESGARIERPAELPHLPGDPTLMIMLWQNLIGNAIKFAAPATAPVITVTCEPDPEAEPEGGWQFSVTDNGIGIPPEFADKVFVIFQRLHSREAYAGTGIGLALCRKIVDHHGGRIWVDTEYAGGTRMCFTLPAHFHEQPPVITAEGGDA
ncbi:sensor histidine kinase [Nocardioides sp. Kera G14]|uniref:sensor histidine kinase n=1 Tax=Nocardioides sp. Kera G14 TaxID=2884264 RepID=UPI001D12FEC6|nr:sensor histidine kinase [Nocardioides sp. Kera G14]UDY22851.1 CHASE3 domain-containing protein [Nocardioides sp. Kera G14]